MEINKIENLIKQAAARRNTYEENGNAALQPQISEPVIQLPTNTSNPNPTKPSTTTSTIVQLTPQQELKRWIRANLKEGRDFGKLPSVNHPVLFREGAIRIMHHLHLRPQVTLLENVVTTDEKSAGYTVTLKIALINPEGIPVIESIGSASTLLEPGLKKASVNTCAQQAQKRALVAAIRMLIV